MIIPKANNLRVILAKPLPKEIENDFINTARELRGEQFRGDKHKTYRNYKLKSWNN